MVLYGTIILCFVVALSSSFLFVDFTIGRRRKKTKQQLRLRPFICLLLQSLPCTYRQCLYRLYSVCFVRSFVCRLHFDQMLTFLIFHCHFVIILLCVCCLHICAPVNVCVGCVCACVRCIHISVRLLVSSSLLFFSRSHPPSAVCCVVLSSSSSLLFLSEFVFVIHISFFQYTRFTSIHCTKYAHCHTL